MLVTDADTTLRIATHQEFPSAIGIHQGQADTPHAMILGNFLVRHGLFLPSTLSEYHYGGPNTFLGCCERLKPRRIDYVGLPQSLQYSRIESHVADDIDIQHAQPREFLRRCRDKPDLGRPAVSYRRPNPVNSSDCAQW